MYSQFLSQTGDKLLWAITSTQLTLWVGQCYCATVSLSLSHLSSSSPHLHHGFSFPLTYQNKFISSILKQNKNPLDWAGPPNYYPISLLFFTAKCLIKVASTILSSLPFSHLLRDPVQLSFHLHHSTEMLLSRDTRDIYLFTKISGHCYLTHQEQQT